MNVVISFLLLFQVQNPPVERGHQDAQKGIDLNGVWKCTKATEMKNGKIIDSDNDETLKALADALKYVIVDDWLFYIHNDVLFFEIKITSRLENNNEIIILRVKKIVPKNLELGTNKTGTVYFLLQRGKEEITLLRLLENEEKEAPKSFNDPRPWRKMLMKRLKD